jgi:secondary thiamine-phosphate synthase enzyme
MQTLPLARRLHHLIRLSTTRSTEFVDVTDQLIDAVAQSGLRTGIVALQTRHTTTAVVVNEREPLLLTDFEVLFDRLAPQGAGYWHDELPLRGDVPADEPRNAHAHCRALLLPSFAVVTVVDGRLQLGRWQRVFLAEFDGPRERELSVVMMGEVAW